MVPTKPMATPSAYAAEAEAGIPVPARRDRARDVYGAVGGDVGSASRALLDAHDVDLRDLRAHARRWQKSLADERRLERGILRGDLTAITVETTDGPRSFRLPTSVELQRERAEQRCGVSC